MAIVRNFTALLAYLDEPYLRWNNPAPLGTGTVVTYRYSPDRDLPAASQSIHPVAKLRAFTPAERAAFERAVDAFGEAADLRFVRTKGPAMIDVHAVWGSDFAGWANLPVSTAAVTGSGELVIDWSNTAPPATDIAQALLLHELGHAVGLDHPFEGPRTLPIRLDTGDNTVMSYSRPLDYTGELRRFDLEALRRIYGDDQDVAAWRVDVAGGRAVIKGTGADDDIVGLPMRGRLAGRAGDDTLIGREANDRIDGGADDDALWGRHGGDTLSGRDGRDRLHGEAGNDILLGGAGADRLWGGAGADLATGNRGDDMLDGGPGRDRLAGRQGADGLSGGGGADRLDGGVGADILQGQGGVDTLRGGDGRDVLAGGRGADRIEGMMGADTLSGDRGADLLDGGGRADRVRGGPGADTLIAGRGDTLRGGAEADTFLFGKTAGGDILISDFAAGRDKFDLTPLTLDLSDGTLTRLDRGTSVRVDFAEADLRITLEDVTIAEMIAVHGDVFD